MNEYLPVVAVLLAVTSLALGRRASSADSFFLGTDAQGSAPGVWTLALSQTTTWIFARSLLNAAILGFYYGIWGTLAYAAYYLSFLTGAIIVDRIRFHHGSTSIQQFLTERFGRAGPACFNVVIALRLVSEVFANLLVIGILFGAAGSGAYTLSILGFAAITLLYSMLGGLRASLRTDVFQMLVFLIVLAILLSLTLASGLVTESAVLFKPFVISDPGPILIIVALLQVWSYPMHDPVMMDRGFLADRETTRRSFLHAAWLSITCILLFGLLGIVAGANAAQGESMNDSLLRLLGEVPMFLFNMALMISAMSTLDSTLSSASKLVIADMGWLRRNVNNGRTVMVLFMVLGLGFVFLDNKDLFSAVAVSGTASMYLFPVIIFCVLGQRRDIAQWSYLVSFVCAIAGAVLYFLESSGHTSWLGDAHKYTKLLWICLTVLVVGCGSFWLGGKGVQNTASATHTH